MSNSIKISPKYGVNPTIPVCFYCGKQKNEIALMGKMGGRGEDIEAPMNMVLDYEPCDQCKEHWNEGIPLIECVGSQARREEQPPIQKRFQDGFPLYLYPTGRWCIIKIEAAKRAFRIPEEQIKLGSPLLIDTEVFLDIIKAGE